MRGALGTGPARTPRLNPDRRGRLQERAGDPAVSPELNLTVICNVEQCRIGGAGLLSGGIWRIRNCEADFTCTP